MDDTNNRAMHASRMFSVPVELMWKMWTAPEHIVHWWGPNGFTCTIHTMDAREGGEWKLTLHGPDGTDFPNRSVFLEIVPHRKIVFEHFNPHFITTVLFESHGQKTQLYWTGEFDTVEMYETVVKVHNADEGQRQNIERLGRYLELQHCGK
ncbi:MAG: SRPBCC domain-containing protein [Bacteroidota bacterium]